MRDITENAMLVTKNGDVIFDCALVTETKKAYWLNHKKLEKKEWTMQGNSLVSSREELRVIW